MPEHGNKDVDVLIDIMMEHTSRMMRMMANGIFNGEDFSHSRNTVLTLQKEIKRRELGLPPNAIPPFHGIPNHNSSSPETNDSRA